VLATRCPNCLTVFRLKPAQLEVSAGQVRCGHCNTLFDGARNRTEVPASDLAAGVSPHVSALEARRSLLARLSARTEPSVGLNAVELALKEHPDRRRAAELSLASGSKQSPVGGKPKSPAGAKTPAADTAPGAPPPKRRLIRALTGPIVFVLALACALQYAWWQREYIRVSWPPSEIAYQTLCRLTGCTISPAHDIDRLQIASMSLRQVDDPRHLALQVVLRNRSAIPQAYPAVELTLTDAHNQASIRKVITPAQYLNADTSADTGIGSHAERTLQMRIDTTTIPANNYRVTIFYP
jgi:predicted Zn finger-like uncharacterized protein